MTKISPAFAPLILSSIMSSTDHGSSARHIVYGLVVDEKGNNIDGADVLIESTVDRRHTISSGDGSYITDICTSGSFDEIHARASLGPRTGDETIYASATNLTAINIVLR
jgi:hypothetical protein